MPYIPEHQRRVEHLLAPLATQTNTPGEWNYVITRFLHLVIERHGVSYALLNTLIGVLGCVTMELYRMVAAPYEDKKRAENGPVSTLDSVAGESSMDASASVRPGA